MDKTNHLPQKCIYCGQYFKPDSRAGERQKACFRAECKQRRKREAQENWKRKNPQVLKNHYQDYVKAWRKNNREKTQTNSKINKHGNTSLEKLVLFIPAGKTEMIRDEIHLKMVAPRTFVAYG